MYDPIESLQKRLEAATGSDTPRAGLSGPQGPGPEQAPKDHPVPGDAELAEWQRVWQAFGRLLDSAEQTLPDPDWTVRPVSSVGPACRPVWPPTGLVRRLWGAGWPQWTVGALVGLLLVGGGLLVWWVGQGTPSGPGPAKLASSSPQPSQQAAGDLLLPSQGQAPPPPSPSQPASREKTVVAKAAPAPAKTSAPQPSANQQPLSWDEPGDETILSLQQISREIEGHGLFQNDPFTGIRQKIEELQTDLDQKML